MIRALKVKLIENMNYINISITLVAHNSHNTRYPYYEPKKANDFKVENVEIEKLVFPIALIL